MSARWQQIRSLAAMTRARYATELGREPPLPLDVHDLAEQVFLLSAFPDPTLDPRIDGELNPALESIRLQPGLPLSRERFIVAHELGHYVLEGAAEITQDDAATLDERASGEDQPEDGVVRVYNTRERREQEANLFALELLIPAEMLSQLVQQPDWTVAGLAEAFGVSTDALRTQLIAVCCLEPVTDATPAFESPAAFAPDPDQQAAVAAPLPTLVVAGPGTGKTRSIVAKFVALVEQGIDPAAILALTFSNKAAEELRTRIIRALSATRPGLAGRVEVWTFHAWGLDVLKSYGRHIGLPLDLRLAPPGDLYALLLRRIAELPLQQYKMLHQPGFYLPAIMQAISRAKDELCSPQEYRQLVEAEAERRIAAAERETAGKTTKKAQEQRAAAEREAARLRELAALYACYEAILRDEGVVDYGDLIMRAVETLRLPEVAREVRERYQYILVDEFQDINYASGQLIALLDGGRGCVWAVGDPWQSIYRFRGASAANLAEFATVYPGTTTVTLMRNYRSRQGIVNAAQALMADDPAATTRPPQQAQRPMTYTPVVLEWAAPDQAAEYAAIVHDILRRRGGRPLRRTPCAHRRGGCRRIASSAQRYRIYRARWRDHAVLCRNHRQVAAMVAALVAHGVPVDGGGTLLDDPAVKDALAICAVVHAPNNPALLRVLTLPDFRVPADDLQELARLARAEHRSLARTVVDATLLDGLSLAGCTALRRLWQVCEVLAEEGDAWRVLTRYLFDLSPAMRQRIARAATGNPEERRALANLGQLTILARTFVRQALPDQRHAGAFVAYVRLLIEADQVPAAAPLPAGADAVRVMTVHTAKGLEFPCVYVPGLHQGVFPPKRHGSAIPPLPALVHGPCEDELQEERYLLYVAMTRARDRLVLSRAVNRADKTLRRSVLLPAAPPWPQRTLPSGRGCCSVRREQRLTGLAIQPVVSANSLETYERCPRQYLYQYGYQLFDDLTAYLRMHGAIHAAVDQLCELAQAGALPATEAELRALLQSIFHRYHLDDASYRDDYLAEALAQARLVWQQLHTDASRNVTVSQQLLIERPHGRVVVRIDALEQTGHESRFVRIKTGRPDKEDLRDLRSALYALAAQTHQPGATLMIHYTATGERELIRLRPDVLERRIETIDTVLASIAAGHWTPNPGQHCVTCAFNLICPV
ncbi:UvrD-helicase domain-containing protein [Kallotenue papyrolyticum]|uniref:UvrD-helicase domain-containing protein n=1 Tax=Kallotenue papyrolyticum TaxID=1325125 RepID=UPI0004709988|nr:UvrD-helicase domain-containing protein [Kallotenue papyrolyticum]